MTFRSISTILSQKLFSRRGRDTTVNHSPRSRGRIQNTLSGFARAAPKHKQSTGLKLLRPIAAIDLETTGTSVDAPLLDHAPRVLRDIGQNLFLTSVVLTSISWMRPSYSCLFMAVNLRTISPRLKLLKERRRKRNLRVYLYFWRNNGAVRHARWLTVNVPS